MRHGHIFCGIGAGARGFNRGHARVGVFQARFECVGGIDVDPAACRDFENLTGARATCMDLFTEDQYRAFHGEAPPRGWKEATCWDLRDSFVEAPHIVFLSAPCKGFSGLLSETASLTDKYQALNGLTLHGVKLLLEAHADDPIPLIIFENVPRIMTRGRWLLDEIVALLRRFGYAVAETTHDCGELGGLGQSRKRFLLVARHEAKVPPFLYEPPMQRLKGVGEVLERLPLPLSGEGGAMHRMPALQWKTWIRLALVRAGADWRSLNELEVVDGYLKDIGIVPTADWHRGALGVRAWDDVGPTVTSNGRPASGAFNVADPREFRKSDFHGLRVNEWNGVASAITTQRSPGSSAQSVADPRIQGHPKSVQLGVLPWTKTAGVVTGKMFVGGGPHAVADPRLNGKRFNTTYRVVKWGGAAPAVAGPGGPAGGLGVADPRFSNWHPGASSSKLRVTEWKGTARPVTGSQQVASGAGAVADPRFDGQPRRSTFGVNSWRDTSGVIGGESLPSNGAFAVADVRPPFARGGREHYKTAGHYGVVAWDQTGYAVSGAGQHDNGFGSVADPRYKNVPECTLRTLPAANDRLVCVIWSLDETWHRPFTTLELAALQGLVDPEEQFELDGLSDSAWRERIGNCVPPPSATAIASVMGETLLRAWSGETFTLSSTPIWVRDVAVALSVDQRGNLPEER